MGKEDVVKIMRLELAKLMQDAKNLVLQKPDMHGTANACIEIHMLKLSALEKQADSFQKELLGTIADLKGVILSKMSDLLSMSMVNMKQELALQGSEPSLSLTKVNFPQC